MARTLENFSTTMCRDNGNHALEMSTLDKTKVYKLCSYLRKSEELICISYLGCRMGTRSFRVVVALATADTVGIDVVCPADHAAAQR